MLVSHPKQFIYFKTKKTASTSVEIFFEPYCVPDGHVPQHSTGQRISPIGIVGSRREGTARGDMFFNHMPAIMLLERIGLSRFNAYFKFCNVRNPFDKMMSRFWWVLSERGTDTAYLQYSFAEVRDRFNRYILETDERRLANDRLSYFIGREAVADDYIRYEHLPEDVERVCARLDVRFDPALIGRYNGGVRHIDEPFPAFYDKDAAEKVARIFAWDIKTFGYALK
jgi:hypothetical protein